MGTTIDDLMDSVKGNYKRNFDREATAEDLATHRERLEKNIEKYPRTGGLIPEDSDSAYSKKQLYEMDKLRRANGEETSDKPVKAPSKPFTRSGGSGSSGVLPNDKSGLDRPHLYKKGGKVEKESKSESKKEMAMDKKQDVAMIKKAFKQHDKQEHKGGKGTSITLKKGGSVKGCGIASKGLTKGRIV